MKIKIHPINLLRLIWYMAWTIPLFISFFLLFISMAAVGMADSFHVIKDAMRKEREKWDEKYREELRRREAIERLRRGEE